MVAEINGLFFHSFRGQKFKISIAGKKSRSWQGHLSTEAIVVANGCPAIPIALYSEFILLTVSLISLEFFAI